MPMHSWRYIINNKTLHLSTFTHAAKAMIEETHCSCTRHVPRCLPRPCPCTTSIIKINNNNHHLISPWLMLKGWNGTVKMYSSIQWTLLTNRKSIACLCTHTYGLNNIGCECNNLNKHYALMQIILRIKNAKSFSNTISPSQLPQFSLRLQAPRNLNSCSLSTPQLPKATLAIVRHPNTRS